MNLKRKLREKAVYFPANPVGHGGQKTYGAPVEIDCHWEDMVTVMVDPKTNNQLAFKSQIMTDYKVKEQGVLWLGTVKELNSPTDPFENDDAAVIQMVDRIPGVSAKQKLFTAYT